MAGCINYVYLFPFVLRCYTSHYNKRSLTNLLTVVGTQKNHLNETVLLSTTNTCHNLMLKSFFIWSYGLSFQVKYYNFTDAVRLADKENKLIHCILLWGALDDQSC